MTAPCSYIYALVLALLKNLGRTCIQALCDIILDCDEHDGKLCCHLQKKKKTYMNT